MPEPKGEGEELSHLQKFEEAGKEFDRAIEEQAAKLLKKEIEKASEGLGDFVKEIEKKKKTRREKGEEND